MLRLTRLKLAAKETAEGFRNHTLGRYHSNWAKTHYCAPCIDCDAVAIVIPKPMANEIDVGGSALAINCKGETNV